MAWFRRSETRSLPRPENELPPWFPWMASSGATVDGRSISQLEALAIGDVWAAVRCLADAASSLPLLVYRAGVDGQEEVTSGKLVDLLNRPSPAVSQADLVSTIMCHLTVWGQCYLAKYRGDSGAIEQLAALHPDRIRPELSGGDILFRYSPYAGPQTLLTTNDVIHIKGMSVDSIWGLSAVHQAGRVLGLSDQLIRHAMSFFDTGRGLPTAVFRMPPESSHAARAATAETVRNEMVARGVLVIEGEGSFEPTTLRLDDAQFSEQRRLSAQEVARVFRLPPHMIAAPSSDAMTYSNIEQQSLDFVRYSLQPWLRRIELAISNDSDLTFQSQYVKFDVDELLRGDVATRANYYHLALDPVAGWMSRAEVRELEDLGPEEQTEDTPPPPAPPIAPAITVMQPTAPTGASNGTSN